MPGHIVPIIPSRHRTKSNLQMGRRIYKRKRFGLKSLPGLLEICCWSSQSGKGIESIIFPSDTRGNEDEDD